MANPKILKLSVSELKQLHDYLHQNRIDDLHSLKFRAYDGIEYCYVHLADGVEKVVYINNPREGEGGHEAYFGIIALFDKMCPPTVVPRAY